MLEESCSRARWLPAPAGSTASSEGYLTELASSQHKPWITDLCIEERWIQWLKNHLPSLVLTFCIFAVGAKMPPPRQSEVEVELCACDSLVMLLFVVPFCSFMWSGCLQTSLVPCCKALWCDGFSPCASGLWSWLELVVAGQGEGHCTCAALAGAVPGVDRLPFSRALET